jgi:hypothetical protein
MTATARADGRVLSQIRGHSKGIQVRGWAGHCPQLIKLIIRYSGPERRNPCIIRVAGHARAALLSCGNQSSLFQQALRLP